MGIISPVPIEIRITYSEMTGATQATVSRPMDTFTLVGILLNLALQYMASAANQVAARTQVPTGQPTARPTEVPTTTEGRSTDGNGAI